MAVRDEEKEQEKGFRVVDRRRFTAEGELKADAPADAPRSNDGAASVSSPLAAGAPKPQGRKPEPPRGDPRGGGQRPGPDAASAKGRAAPAEPPGIDFLSFVASLATNALAAMGALPEEQTRGMPRNPELAREYIDILTMLHQKTQGNLTPREEQAMQQLLTDLRMQFVELGRRR